jgi:hypothetical protein
MGKKYTKLPQHYQMAIKISNDHKIYQHFPYQGPPKFTQIGIFGLKIYLLATLAQTAFVHKRCY